MTIWPEWILPETKDGVSVSGFIDEDRRVFRSQFFCGWKKCYFEVEEIGDDLDCVIEGAISDGEAMLTALIFKVIYANSSS